MIFANIWILSRLVQRKNCCFFSSSLELLCVRVFFFMIFFWECNDIANLFKFNITSFKLSNAQAPVVPSVAHTYKIKRERGRENEQEQHLPKSTIIIQTAFLKKKKCYLK